MVSIRSSEREWKADQLQIERELEHLVSAEGAPSTFVGKAMRYAVLGGGKRIRPLLSLRVARSVGASSGLVLRGAAAVEILHCASLIIDDLPCMDNEAERRGQPTVHVVYGEPTAILAAFGLVALAARCIVEHPEAELHAKQVSRFQQALLGTLNASGLIAGQELDLNLDGHQGPLERAVVNEMKTVPLFELAVQAGTLGKTLSAAEWDGLSCFGREFGRAFQQIDDHLDGDSNCETTLNRRLDAVRHCLDGFPGETRELEELLEYLYAKAFAQDSRHR